VQRIWWPLVVHFQSIGFRINPARGFPCRSILFYGCSLSDPDILANLDGVREVRCAASHSHSAFFSLSWPPITCHPRVILQILGPETGPHFWVCMRLTGQHGARSGLCIRRVIAPYQITADHVSEARRQFLLDQYTVHCIRAKDVANVCT
jgi:hypothetical protein